MAGLSKRTFIEIIGKYGVSLFSKSEDDLLKDIQNVLSQGEIIAVKQIVLQ